MDLNLSNMLAPNSGTRETAIKRVDFGVTSESDPSDPELVREWLDAMSQGNVAHELEAVYRCVADAVEARGPACWASGRCCNFARTGHRLYVTGLETAFMLVRGGLLDSPTGAPAADSAAIAAAVERGDCPYLNKNVCGVHTVKPLGCRIYFCDRSAQGWQQELSEKALSMVRRLHDENSLHYRYGEWRAMLALFAAHC